MKKLALLLVLLFPAVCLAEVVITIDTTGWTQRQKNMRKAMAYRIAYENGENQVPEVIGDDIIFPDLSKETKKKITGQAILDELNESDLANAAASAAKELKKDQLNASIKAKLKNTLGMTDEEIDFLGIIPE